MKIHINHKSTILDIGCGSGWGLSYFHHLGALPENLYGIDIIDERISNAKTNFPNYNFLSGNASNLPYKNQTFDIIYISTVFSSILDPCIKKKLLLKLPLPKYKWL